jgi:alpha-tubulin suppressor-like RCC1 family protein
VGCECELSNEGREVCNGRDDDCDGVVDNPFVGGQVAAGGHHTCAVDATGVVNCWGDESLEGEARSGTDAFWEVVAGLNHNCALTRDGEAFCWGDNRDGQVGPDARRHADDPVRVSDELRFVDIATGAAHSCGLTYGGLVYCWGANDYGQLGDGSLDGRAEPVLVDSNRHDFLDVTAGDFHTCAARSNGEVVCWGANLLGQTGQEDFDDVLVPTAVGVPDALIFVEAGSNHTCGITGAGGVYCWGNNSYGQLGDESRVSTHLPQKVASNLEFLALSAGTTHTCGVVQGGKLWCWGSNTSGQLSAKASGEASLEPHLMSSALAFTDLAAGEAHTCGLSRDGRLHCWGDGSRGQLTGGCD